MPLDWPAALSLPPLLLPSRRSKGRGRGAPLQTHRRPVSHTVAPGAMHCTPGGPRACPRPQGGGRLSFNTVARLGTGRALGMAPTRRRPQQAEEGVGVRGAGVQRRRPPTGSHLVVSRDGGLWVPASATKSRTATERGLISPRLGLLRQRSRRGAYGAGSSCRLESTCLEEPRSCCATVTSGGEWQGGRRGHNTMARRAGKEGGGGGREGGACIAGEQSSPPMQA